MRPFLIFCAAIAFQPLCAQDLNLGQTYAYGNNGPIPQSLRQVETWSSVPTLVDGILKDNKWDKNFVTLPVEIDKVSAVHSERLGNMLLYSPHFFNKALQAEKPLAYGLLAYAIALFQMNPPRQSLSKREASLAYLETGKALARLRSRGFSRGTLAELCRNPKFGMGEDTLFRYENMARGWDEAIAAERLREKGGLGYNGMLTESLQQSQLPQFPWPPPQCGNVKSSKVEQSKKATLGDAERQLAAALDLNGYSNRSYFAVPGGFAIVTQLEQFDPETGKPKEGKVRWLDYPVREFSNLLEYFETLILPKPADCRLFLLMVLDTTYQANGKAPTHEEVSDWLEQGSRTGLPAIVKKCPLNDNFSYNVHVYEFRTFVTDKHNHRLQCKGTLNAGDHLKRAGLPTQLRF